MFKQKCLLLKRNDDVPEQREYWKNLSPSSFLNLLEWNSLRSFEYVVIPYWEVTFLHFFQDSKVKFCPHVTWPRILEAHEIHWWLAWKAAFRSRGGSPVIFLLQIKCFGDEIFKRGERGYNFKRKGLVSPWPSVKSLVVLCVVFGLKNLCTWPGSLVEAWAASKMGSRPNWGVLLEVQASVRRGFVVTMTPVWGTFHVFSHGNEVIDGSLGNWLTEGKWCFPASCTSQKPPC